MLATQPLAVARSGIDLCTLLPFIDTRQHGGKSDAITLVACAGRRTVV